MSKIAEGLRVWLGNPDPILWKLTDLARFGRNLSTSRYPRKFEMKARLLLQLSIAGPEQICSFDRSRRRSSSSSDFSRSICSVVATALEPHLLHVAELIQAPPSSVVATGPDNLFREAPRRSCCRRNRLIANSATDAACLQEPRTDIKSGFFRPSS